MSTDPLATPATKPKALRLSPHPRILPASGWSTALVRLVAGAMAFLAVLTLAASMSAADLAAEWRKDLSGAATVWVSGTPDALEEKIPQVVEILRSTPGIGDIRVLSDADQAALLAPWLGEIEDMDLLAAPRLIDVALEEGGLDSAALQARLDLTVSGARYDDHAAWRAPLAAASAMVRQLALGATALVLLTAGGMVALATRAILAANADVIATVRLIGGEDRFVAGELVKRTTRLSALGSLVGALLGAVALMAFPEIDADQALADVLRPDTTEWAILVIGVPLASAALSWGAARWAVRAVLRRMP